MMKRLAYTVAPRLAVAVSSSRGRRRSHRLIRQWGLADLNQRLIGDLGNRVIEGPFKGLILTQLAQLTHIGPYLLGTYEMELTPWWNRLLEWEFDQIVDVGANFGYYAVGLALRFPRTPVFAFDTDWWARRALMQMTAANHAANVSVRGFCSRSWLAAHLHHHALIVSDCEGGEERLFCEKAIPAFATATFVIELHEALVPGVTAKCRSAFARTHAVHVINSRTETPVGVRSTFLTADEMRRVAHEIRAPQQWLVATPSSAGHR
jgi:hypothetical protein